jgi:hypothetical protein
MRQWAMGWNGRVYHAVKRKYPENRLIGYKVVDTECYKEILALDDDVISGNNPSLDNRQCRRCCKVLTMRGEWPIDAQPALDQS